MPNNYIRSQCMHHSLRAEPCWSNLRRHGSTVRYDARTPQVGIPQRKAAQKTYVIQTHSLSQHVHTEPVVVRKEMQVSFSRLFFALSVYFKSHSKLPVLMLPDKQSSHATFVLYNIGIYCEINTKAYSSWMYIWYTLSRLNTTIEGYTMFDMKHKVSELCK